MKTKRFPDVMVFEPAESNSYVQYAAKTNGICHICDIPTDLGQHHPVFHCMELANAGSTISFTLSDVTVKDELIFEIQEVHSRYDNPFSYHVLVNESPIYYRTYAPCCDGLNHYFVRLKGALSHCNITVTLRADENFPIRFYRIYAIIDALLLAESESVNAPMMLGLFSPGLSGDKTEDIRRLIDCRKNYAPYPVICGYDIFYMRMSREGLYEKLNYILQLSAETGISISLDLNSWWSGTPTGMDGLGGNFRDLEYQQVVYDPTNATGYGTYQLTTPNYWKNLPWMSICNDYYNKAREQRLRDTAEFLSRRLTEYRAEGGVQPQISVFTENEPDYWHCGAWHDTYRSIAGIEPAAIKSAASDGIMLNPEALDDSQRAWLWKKLTDYIVGVGTAISGGIGNGISIVKDGKAIVPDDILTEHCYTHATTGRSNQPYGDQSHAMWETHLIDSLRLGYQGGVGPDDPRALEYASCYGRLAGVNKEQLRENSYGILPYSYLFGADFQTIFNYNHCTESLKKAPKPQDYRNQPVPTFCYDNQLFNYEFDSDESLSYNKLLIYADNIIFCNARGSRAVRADDFKPNGVLIFRIHHDNGFPNGLITEWRATVNRNTSNVLELGYSPNDFCYKEELTGKNQYIVSYFTDWSDRIDRTISDYYLRISIPSGLHATEYNAPERNSICSLIIRIPRDEHSGPYKDTFTFSELRALHRLSERREDARRLMTQVAENSEVIQQFEQGRYQTAYRTMLSELTQQLPAKFLVYNSGPLGNLGLTVESDAPVLLTLLSNNNGCYQLQIDTIDGKTANLRFRSDKENLYCTKENNTYTVSGEKTETSVSKITVYPQKSDLPFRLSGRLLQLNRERVIFQSQDTKFTLFSDSIPLPVSSDCHCFLSQDGALEEAEIILTEFPSDMSATLITDGKFVTEIHAVNGFICGVTENFSEASIVGEIRYPTITVSNGLRQVTARIGSECVFEFSTASGKTLHTSKIGNLGITIGQKIALQYYPPIDGCPQNRAAKISDPEK